MSAKRKLFALNRDQKREICVYHGNNASKTQQDIAALFTVRYGHPVSRQTVGDILATNAVGVLMKYSEHSDLATPDDMQSLSVINRCVDYMRCCSQKQTSMFDFFRRRTIN